MDEFDFYKAMFGINVSEAEGYAEIVGRVVGAVYKGLLASGLEERLATKVMHVMTREILRSFRDMSREDKNNG